MAHTPTIGTSFALAVLFVVACATPNKYYPTDAAAGGTAPTTDSLADAPMDQSGSPGISPDLLGPEHPAERGDAASAADDGSSDASAGRHDTASPDAPPAARDGACGSPPTTPTCRDGQVVTCPQDGVEVVVPCDVPLGGRASCVNGQCDFTCTTGNKCGGGCFDCCNDSQCPPRANNSVQCTSHRCIYTCSAVDCGGGTCVPLQGACAAMYSDPPGFCRDGDLCQSGRSECGGGRELGKILKPTNDYATLVSQCLPAMIGLARALCDSNPDAKARLAAGQDVTIYYYVERFGPDGKGMGLTNFGLAEPPGPLGATCHPNGTLVEF